MKRLNAKALAALGFLVYFSSYVTRYNYKTIIEAFVSSEGVLKSAASLPVTFSFLSYGIGQLISGYVGDRVSPHKLILAGLLSSSAINLLMTTNTNIVFMCVLWTLNGLAQSFIWPPLIKILSGSMTRDDYNKAVVIVNAAGSVGTVFVHIAAPALIAIGGWRAVFVFSAVIGVLSVVMFRFFTRKVEIQTLPDEIVNKEGKEVKLGPLILASGLVFICFTIMLQGLLRDGIDTWTPSFLTQAYNIDASFAIFLSTTVPIFSIVSIKITSEINRRFVKNELTLSIILFLISSVCTALTTAINSMVVSVILLSLATGCMHGVNLMLVCQIPGRFAKYGKASLISGSMNFFTYVGSAASMWGLAKITESFGWTTAFLICSGIAVIGITLCLIAQKKWCLFSLENK